VAVNSSFFRVALDQFDTVEQLLAVPISGCASRYCNATK